MSPEIEAHLRLCPQLPTLSGVALRLVALARDPDVERDAVAALLSRDTALAAKVLRVANSPLYRRVRAVVSIRDAVAVLGLNATLTLALGFSLTASLRATGEWRFDLDHYWRRALLSGLAARLLGDRLGLRPVEELFLAGLLQDIGMLALDAALPDRYARVGTSIRDHAAVVAGEQAEFGADHREAGAWLLAEWALPEYLSMAARVSHERGAPDVPLEWEAFMGCIAVSGRIADVYLVPGPAMKEATAAAVETADACLGVALPAVGEVLERMAESLPEIEALFEVPIVSREQAWGLTAQAQELVATRHLQQPQTATGTRARANEDSRAPHQLRDPAQRDPLTGLFNRHHFDELLERAFVAATGNGEPLSLAHLDLDHFKSINDRYGHPVGDAVLAAVARHLEDRLRQGDFLARYGDEEFVLLLPGIELTAARPILERMRSAAETLAHTLDTGETLHVTLSGGVACHGEDGRFHEGPSELLRAADQALYRAKREGRNRVVITGCN